MPRPMLLLATAGALGVLVADDLLPIDAQHLLLLAAMLLALGLAGSARAAAMALAAAAFAIGASSAAVERAAYDAGPLRAWVSSTSVPLTWLEGIVREDARLRQGELVVTLDVEKASVGGHVVSMPGRARVHIAGHARFPDVAGGDRVALWAELRAPRGFRNPGSPDLAAQARTEGIHAVGRCKSARLASVVGASAGMWERTAAHARRWSHDAIV